MAEQRLFQRFGGNPAEKLYKFPTRKTGHLNLSLAGVLAGGQLLNGLTLVGGSANANDADGRAVSYTSAGGGANQAGLVSPAYVLTQSRWNMKLWARFKLSQIVTQRFWIALCSATVMGTDTPETGAIHCIGIRASTGVANTNFVAYTSDGALANVQNFATAVPQDTAVHNVIFDIKNGGQGVTITLDNQSLSFTTRLPTVTQNLGLDFCVQELAAAAKVIRFYGCAVESDR